MVQTVYRESLGVKDRGGIPTGELSICREQMHCTCHQYLVMMLSDRVKGKKVAS